MKVSVEHLEQTRNTRAATPSPEQLSFRSSIHFQTFDEHSIPWVVLEPDIEGFVVRKMIVRTESDD